MTAAFLFRMILSLGLIELQGAELRLPAAVKAVAPEPGGAATRRALGRPTDGLKPVAYTHVKNAPSHGQFAICRAAPVSSRMWSPVLARSAV